MTKAQFAAAVGISQSTLASMEYGGRPSLVTIEKLAAFLQVPVSELDPQGYATGRSGGLRHRRAPALLSSLASGANIFERLSAVHSAFTLAHEQAIAAVRARDVGALFALRAQQADLLAQQDEWLDAYVSGCSAVATDQPSEG
jgi:transcriptional regulator with XRE-family HTH domain